jgi:Sugar phosphate isomerases/epimerases
MLIQNKIVTRIIFSFLLIYCNQSISAQQVGLQLYSLRAHFKQDVPSALSKIHNWGITEIEGGGSYSMPREEYKQLLEQNHLKMVSIGIDFNKLSDPSAAIEEAKFYGASYIVCFWIPHDADNFTIDDINKAVDAFNKAGKIMYEQGLKFCYHPHGYEFRPYQNGTLFDYLVKHTDPRYVNYEMDVFWIKNPGQDPVALLKKYPTRFPLVHLKDRRPGTENNQNGKADEESNVVLGKGDVGIKDIMLVAKKIGVKHYFIEDESSHSEEQIPQSLVYLNLLEN